MTKNMLLTLSALLWLSTHAARAQTPVSVTPNSWSLGTPMPTARQDTFTGVIGGNIYVIGGESNTAFLTVNEIYNTVTNSWSTGASMPTARSTGASAVVNGIFYAIGGQTPSGALSIVEAYDPASNTWSTKASMPAAEDSMFAIVDNGIIYVIGGYSPVSGRLATVFSYDPTSNVWSSSASLKIGKSSSALGVIGGMIVSAGGLTQNSGVTTDNEGYSVANNSWTTLAPAPTARNGACFGPMGDTLYVAGGNPVGNTGSPQLDTMDAYDADTNSWFTGLPTMPHAVVSTGSAGIGGALYCFGGSNSGALFQGTVFDYLQIYQAPAASPVVSTGGVVSASAFGGFTSVSPGSWIEIYGANLAGDTRGWTGSDFNGVNAPTSLDGTSVSIGGQAAFVDYISPGQVNALIPSAVPTGPQQITVKTATGTSAPLTINVNPEEPGLLATPSFTINGTPYAVAFFADGTYVLPTGAVAGLTSRPARPGDTIILYGVGFGPVIPNIPAGQLVGQSNTLASSFQMSIGGMPATAAYAGLAPSYTGLYQFNITVPNVASGNAVPLTFTLGGSSGIQQLYIAVGN
jgi:uncharacterized protein (TIGR03437 family)